jgi:formylglycine-generating enzyme
MNRKHLVQVLGLTVAACALSGWAGPASADIIIETVPVGDVGNAADTRYATPGYGAVAYAYNVGKYEVTAGQYCEFLNAVAGVDNHQLYNTNMYQGSSGCGILRSGGGAVGNPYTYSVDAAFLNRPVNWVGIWDACRFANWLHNGQGNGDTETGTYTMTPSNITETVARNSDWKWAVTSEDEWYKAAYYNPAHGTYFDYPTSSNSIPGRDLSDASGNNANYASSYPIQSPYYTTLVGEFQNSPSPYSTFDQGGNVWEWNEAIFSSWDGCLRGAGYNTSEICLRASNRSGLNFGPQNVEYAYLGFRVVQVPEPASLGILSIGVIGMLVRRSSARRQHLGRRWAMPVLRLQFQTARFTTFSDRR